MAEERIERMLAQTASRIGFPPTPAITQTVVARLETDRSRRARPRVPGLALWSRRRLVVALTLATMTLAGAAFAARLGIGAIRIHVGPTPSSAPPAAAERGAALGRSVTLAEAQASAGFSVLVPSSLPVPDRVFVSRTVAGDHMVVLAWRASASLPPVQGTGWGLVLLELPGNQALAVKDLGSGNRLEAVRVGGASGYWILGPHDLIVRTPAGERSFRVTGNVLIWRVGSVSLRLESELPEAMALELSRSVG